MPTVHMGNKFLIPLLIALNATIILSAELLGHGSALHDTGFIHLAAIFFCGLAAYMVFRQWKVQKNTLLPILKNVLVALVVFSLAHMIEYVLANAGEQIEALADVAVLVCYVLGLLIIYDGYSSILKMSGRKHQITSLFPSAIGSLFGAIIFVTLQGVNPLADPLPLLSSFLLFLNICAAIILIKTNSIFEKMMPSLARFFRFSAWCMVAIICAALLEFGEAYNILPGHQTEYFTHFFFYIGLSLQIIALNSIFSLGGVYADLRETK